MIKTEIRYSWIYDVLLNNHDFNFSLREYKELQRKCKPFEKLYAKNISQIIKLIEKVTKRKKWVYSFIPIYLVKVKPRNEDNKWKAFADPLTMKYFYKESPERLLKRLIHELVHVNLDNEEQIKRGREKNEELVKSITENVWRNLNLK
ncbi:hypothetical protein HYT92_03820 [Candidatus Pacearchaeota archaeon]|nr:hypothetical protein [Candidatus Pacearchaeota archaeon]